MALTALVLLASLLPARLTFAQETDPPPAEDLINLLNPDDGTDPRPKVSDKPNGSPESYDIVAWVSPELTQVIVEVSVTTEPKQPALPGAPQRQELTLGLMERGDGNTWTYEWDIPAGFPSGPATIEARLYQLTIDGAEEVAVDRVPVDVDPAAYHSAEIVWPAEDGALGFNRHGSGRWVTVIDATSSATQADAWYTIRTPGAAPDFIRCGTSNERELLPGLPGVGRLAVTCMLDEGVTPEMVSGVGVFAAPTGGRHSGDVVPVRPYIQESSTGTIEISGPAMRMKAGSGCMQLDALVLDHLKRPIQYANVDVHVSGPSDQAGFGGGSGVPERHNAASAPSCSLTQLSSGLQGRHVIPAGDDHFHAEGFAGVAGGSSTLPPGTFRFQLFSPVAGITKITAWIDSRLDPVSNEWGDNDVQDPDEGHAPAIVQWLAEAPRVEVETRPIVPAGECIPVLARARDGSSPIPAANVDFSVQAEASHLVTCEVRGSSIEDAGVVLDEKTVVDAATDKQGNALIGLRSDQPERVKVTAWLDGEPAANDDILGTGEASATTFLRWLGQGGEPRGYFVSPAPFGSATPGAGDGTRLPDKGGVARIVVAVDVPAGVAGVPIWLSADGSSFRELGTAERIGATEGFELDWRVDVPDGAYTLRAHVGGAPVETRVTIGAGDAVEGAAGAEWVRLDRPDGPVLEFVLGKAAVTGTASPGAEGVDLFYRYGNPFVDAASAIWKACGYVALPTTPSALQSFSTTCGLQPGDRSREVTAIGALAFDCSAPRCDATPHPASVDPRVPASRAPGQKEAGDAAFVVGVEARPRVDFLTEVQEHSVGECVTVQLFVRDFLREPLPHENVDVQISGSFVPCSTDSDSGRWSSAESADAVEAPPPADAPRHLETRSWFTDDLELSFTSDSLVDTSVRAWIDRNDNDVLDGGETSDDSVVLWIGPDRRCSILGTAGADTLRGSSGPDVICALDGNDVVRALGGRDLVLAGAGDDVVFGGHAADVLRGGPGEDVLTGGPGSDDLRAGGGTDACAADAADERHGCDKRVERAARARKERKWHEG